MDIYFADCQINFESTKHYLIAACSMTSFDICKDTLKGTAEAFVVAPL